MDNKDNIQEFSLEEIMQEFGTESQDSEDQIPEQEDTAEEVLQEEQEVSEEEGPSVSMDETRVIPVLSDEEAPRSDSAMTDATIRLDAPLNDDTIRLEDISELSSRPREKENPGPAGAEPVEDEQEEQNEEEMQEESRENESEEASREEHYQLTSEQIPTPKPILFRSRLGELKRKLVAGPEKRYYDLTEIGLGRVQIAIFLNILIVALCAGGTCLYAMGMVMSNRLRLMIFSQILAMMVSALLGCYVLLDGIVDLFTGKFSLNSMLFLTLAACAADAVFCLQELRVPCCAAFSLEMTFALWNRSLCRSTEMGQMDTLRKATRLDALVKVPEYFGSRAGILRTEGRVEDFMDNYAKRTGPEKALNIYAVLSVLACIGIAVLAGVRHDLSLAIQVFSTSMLVAVPAGAFVSQSRPAAILERRMHMVGTVICGWQGVKTLCGKASFPLNDRDLFPAGSIKLNGVKFFGEREPEDVIASAAALMAANGGGLEPVFTQLRKSRNGAVYAVESFQAYPSGGIGGIVAGEQLLMGSAEFLKEQGVEIPDSAMVSQAVYCAQEGQLTAVFAINYSRTKSAAGGLVTLGGYRKIRPLVLSGNFMITAQLLKEKFGVRTKRYDFPIREDRETLSMIEPDPELIAGALTTQQNLSSAAYAVTGARTLRTSCRAGLVIHIFAGIVGLLIMAALAYLGDLQLLSPFRVLLYQAVWLFPGLLITEWTRTV